MGFTANHFDGLLSGEVLSDSGGDKWIVLSTVEAHDAILVVSADGRTVDGDSSAEFFKEGYTRDLITSAVNQVAQQLAGAQVTPAPLTAQQQANYGGIMNWMPATPPQILPSGGGSWTFYDPGEVPKPAKTRRQVSHNGKDWVDYRHLLDADDFELYAHRREV